MEPAGNLVKNLMEGFHRKLVEIYPEHEIQNLVYMLFEEFLGWQRTKVHLSLNDELPENIMKSFNLTLDELSTGKPIQYILHKAWFNGSTLKVDSNVLVPRPETEELCTLIKQDFSGMKQHPFSILDIGTGSGCIAIDLKKAFSMARITAIDVSFDALELANINAISNLCEISFIQTDILNQSEWANFGKFDIIVSNPPYVTESERTKMHRNVVEFEPGKALFVPDDDPLVYYNAIALFANRHMNSMGRLYFEINERFGKEMHDLMHNLSFDEVAIIHDFQGKERFVSARLHLE